MSSPGLCRIGGKNQAIRDRRYQMDSNRGPPHQPGKGRRSDDSHHLIPGPSSSQDGSTTLRRRPVGVQGQQHWDSLPEIGGGDGDVLGRGASGNDSTDWEVEESDLPQIHTYPGSAIDTRGCKRDDDKPELHDSWTDLRPEGITWACQRVEARRKDVEEREEVF